MKKRLAVITLTAITALTAIGGATGAMRRDDGPHQKAPAAQCGAGDTACKISSTSQQGPLVPDATNTQISSSSDGTGYHVG